MGSNRLTVVGNRKIYFKDPVTELIIKQKGLIGIGIRIFKNSAKSVRDVRRFIHPRVVEIIWLGITGSWCSHRFIQVGGVLFRLAFTKTKKQTPLTAATIKIMILVIMMPTFVEDFIAISYHESLVGRGGWGYQLCNFVRGGIMKVCRSCQKLSQCGGVWSH